MLERLAGSAGAHKYAAGGTSLLLLPPQLSKLAHSEAAVGIVLRAGRAAALHSEASIAGTGLHNLQLLVAGGLFRAHLLLAANPGRIDGRLGGWLGGANARLRWKIGRRSLSPRRSGCLHQPYNC